MKKIFFALSVILSVKATAQQVSKSLIAYNNTPVGFLQFTPSDYNLNPTKKYPVIIFFHGIGERGNGSTDLYKVALHGIPKNIASGHPMRFYWNGKWESFIVLSPQLSTAYGSWPVFYAEEMIRYAKNNLRIDTDRIILSGLSLGGGAVWGYPSQSASNASNIAGMGVVCGVSGSGDLCNVANANIPVWAFHASDDNVVSVNNTHNAITKLQQCNPELNTIKTIWPTGKHFIWQRAFTTDYSSQNPTIFEWFLAQNKSLPINKLPVAKAGRAITVSSTKAQITASGALSEDSDGKIVRYVWTQQSGPSVATIKTPVSETGVTNILGLTNPGTYTFELKAIDDRASTATDVLEVNVVNAPVPNIAPVAAAGNDLEIATTRADLTGSASYDPDGFIVSYEWSMIQGPGQYTFENPNSSNTEVFNLGSGRYHFQLKTIDDQGDVSFDTLIVNEVSVVLPDLFTSISAHENNNEPFLKWKVAAGAAGTNFRVEQSEDGTIFKSVGNVKLEKGVSEYSFSIQGNINRVNQTFYRVVLVHKSGQQKYSSIVTLSSGSSKQTLKCYPIPTSKDITIELAEVPLQGMDISIYSLGGIKLDHYKQTGSSKLAKLNVEKYLPGTYILEIRVDAKKPYYQKIVKY